MKQVDRAHYCPDKRNAYQDSPQTIGYGATISAPHMHAHAAESLLAFLQPGSSVLDVGSGSGYLLSVFHHLIKGETSRVVGIEHIPQLVDLSRENLINDGMDDVLRVGKVEIVHGDGRKGEFCARGGKKTICIARPLIVIYVRRPSTRTGWPNRAPYNAIHVGAASPPSVLSTLEAQLARPGRLFIPVEDPNTRQQDIYHVDKDEQGNVTRKKMYGVRYVPLTDQVKQWSG